jgi:ribosomal protein S18 acetylase RimI-like enzyme
MEEARIRDFVPEDAESIVGYREESGRVSFPGLVIDRARERERIMEHAAKYPGTIKIAEIGGSVVGYVRFRVSESSFGDYGIIDAIFVESGLRKTGIGKLLQEAAERRLISMGVRDVEAVITNTNAPSLGFFKSVGYEEKRTVVEKRLEP